MKPSHLRGDSPVVLNLDVPLSGHDSRSPPNYFRNPSVVSGDPPFGLFQATFSPEFNSRWQALRIQQDVHQQHLMNQDGLSPLLIPAYNDAQYDTTRWAAYPPHPSASPRQRPGFPRAMPGIAETAASPLLSDGFPSPSLPVLSPHASERSKQASRTPRHKQKGFARLSSPEYDSQVAWLVLYFAFNLGLTLYNKLVLVHFPFPYTLTALHALCGSIGGCFAAAWRTGDHFALAAFSILYAVNIAVSNVSLQLVTVPFHQVVRAATPIFTTLLSLLLFGTHYSRMKLLTLVPVMAGVALVTYGDYYFSWWGLVLTLTGTFLAALKTIYTNVLQSAMPLTSSAQQKPKNHFFGLEPSLLLPPRLHLHPLDLLARMSPLAFVQCVFYAYLSGELSRICQFSSAETWNGACLRASVLLGNGAIAFGLNVARGALNMTVAANVKQVLTVVCAVSLFDLTITAMNAAGIAVTLAGGAWYAWVEYADKVRRKGGRRPLPQQLYGYAMHSNCIDHTLR
ncbi:hypothetical protein B0H21DRAFT_751349 [Amylocystis lapponica]|nr:hypothetical protein B0H21DRAFT_751349 [Amylocystis lapponica]